MYLKISYIHFWNIFSRTRILGWYLFNLHTCIFRIILSSGFHCSDDNHAVMHSYCSACKVSFFFVLFQYFLCIFFRNLTMKYIHCCTFWISNAIFHQTGVLFGHSLIFFHSYSHFYCVLRLQLYLIGLLDIIHAGHEPVHFPPQTFPVFSLDTFYLSVFKLTNPFFCHLQFIGNPSSNFFSSDVICLNFRISIWFFL